MTFREAVESGARLLARAAWGDGPRWRLEDIGGKGGYVTGKIVVVGGGKELGFATFCVGPDGVGLAGFMAVDHEKRTMTIAPVAGAQMRAWANEADDWRQVPAAGPGGDAKGGAEHAE